MTQYVELKAKEASQASHEWWCVSPDIIGAALGLSFSVENVPADGTGISTRRIVKTYSRRAVALKVSSAKGVEIDVFASHAWTKGAINYPSDEKLD